MAEHLRAHKMKQDSPASFSHAVDIKCAARCAEAKEHLSEYGGHRLTVTLCISSRNPQTKRSSQGVAQAPVCVNIARLASRGLNVSFGIGRMANLIGAGNGSPPHRNGIVPPYLGQRTPMATWSWPQFWPRPHSARKTPLPWLLAAASSCQALQALRQCPADPEPSSQNPGLLLRNLN